MQSLRDPARAVALAQRVLPPSAGHYWRYLALAQYRSEQWQAAANSIQQAMDLRQGGDAFDWLLLAMAQWQLGQKDAALETYSQAQEAIKTGRPLFYEYLGVMAVQRFTARSGGADERRNRGRRGRECWVKNRPARSHAEAEPSPAPSPPRGAWSARRAGRLI